MYLVGAIVFAFCLLNACETIAPQENFQGKYISNTECKSGDVSILEDETGDSLSCIEFEYEKSESKLEFEHINAAFNCCPGKIFATFELKKDTIIISENEEEHACRCMCLYDLKYEVQGITPGKYFIKVVEPYSEESEKLFFEINLNVDTKGKFCVKRLNYPWNK